MHNDEVIMFISAIVSYLQELDPKANVKIQILYDKIKEYKKNSQFSEVSEFYSFFDFKNGD